MKKLNIGLVGVDPSNMNKGCEALLYSQLHLFSSYFEDFRFTFFVIHGQEYKTISYDVNNQKIPVTVLPLLSFESIGYTVRSLRNINLLRIYKELDYVFAIGYGDSFSDIYGDKRFDAINYPIILFQRLGLKVIFMPQTIGPFKNKSIEDKAIKSLEKAYKVYPRDLQSLEYVKEKVSRNDVVELIDIAFFMPYTRKVFSNNKINVGLSISGLLWRNGYSGKNEFGLVCDYKVLTRQIIEYFKAKDNVNIYLTPHVVSSDSLCFEDYQLALDLVEEYGDDILELSPLFKTPIQAKNFISGLDFFIGSRMHACIAAYSSTVPVVPISYSRKFTGLFVDTLNYDVVANPLSQDNEKILQMIDNAFENRAILKRRIENSMAGQVAQVKSELINLFKSILV